MRTIIDLPEDQYEALKSLAKREQASRAEVVRRALAEYLARRAPEAQDDAFGLWRDRAEDGLACQEKLRQEWDR
ncbi:ribbon-helix-helix domain-containing protein [Pseudazoarcus pumilus]|jgi:metal-responsive CopG/Arc/MetJ family transcriptional regulator|uniref:CopG family transcriptional regulator n=1 Tax=Pseudazoarcus pumilus TaxID=2067960 RepID=A0A2I6S9T3_9RHOO|nr:CopG family transcriptional regulator [Pseudazoarcus pumilus]AUN96020.1 CopG family transcriptional regulator [Pseudazoarcus pumilus]